MEGNGGKNDAGLTRHVEEDDARVLAHFVVSRAPVEGVDLSFLNLQGACDFLGEKTDSTQTLVQDAGVAAANKSACLPSERDLCRL